MDLIIDPVLLDILQSGRLMEFRIIVFRTSLRNEPSTGSLLNSLSQTEDQYTDGTGSSPVDVAHLACEFRTYFLVVMGRRPGLNGKYSRIEFSCVRKILVVTANEPVHSGLERILKLHGENIDRAIAVRS